MELVEPNAQPYETTQTPEARDLSAESKVSFPLGRSHLTHALRLRISLVSVKAAQAPAALGCEGECDCNFAHSRYALKSPRLFLASALGGS